MNANVNIEAVKQYNATLKQYKEQATNINAEINFLNKEIDNICAELTTELGMTVTKDNVEQICKDLCDKINGSLQSGNAILSKIANEVNKANTPATASVGQAVPTAQPAPAAPAFVNESNMVGAAPVNNGNTLPPIGAPAQAPQNSQAGPVFAEIGNGINMDGAQSLPPFFSNN